MMAMAVATKAAAPPLRKTKGGRPRGAKNYMISIKEVREKAADREITGIFAIPNPQPTEQCQFWVAVQINDEQKIIKGGRGLRRNWRSLKSIRRFAESIGLDKNSVIDTTPRPEEKQLDLFGHSDE